MRRRAWLGILCAATLGWAQDILINVPQILSDGAGYNWDIQQGGGVSEGTSDAYDGAMVLTINGINPPFSPSGQGYLEGRAFRFSVEGPAAGLPDGVVIERWVYVPTEIGCAMWIDVFENSSGAAVEINYGIRSDHGSDGGTEVFYTSSGDTIVDEEDFAAISDDQFGGSDPAVVHIWGSEDSDMRPGATLSTGTDVLIYSYPSLSVGPGDRIGVGYVEAQRTSREDAQAFVESFDPSETILELAELAEVSLLNFAGGRQGFKLLRGEDADILELRGGDFLAGEILVENYVLQTSHGLLDVPAEKVASVIFGELGTDRLFLVNGEIVAGSLDLATVTFRTASGRDLQALRGMISRLGYRKRADEPEDALAVKLGVHTRDGAVYACSPQAEVVALQTVFGKVQLPWKQIVEIDLSGELHHVRLKSGSSLHGLLLPETLGFDGSLSYTFPTRTLLRIMGQEAEKAGAPQVIVGLRNGDVVLGRPLFDEITVRCALGELMLKTGEIELIERDKRQPDLAVVVLRRSGSLRGSWLGETFDFELADGARMTLYPSDCMWVEFPVPEADPELQAAIEEAIGQLYSEDYAVREAAKAQLLEIGEAALPALYEAAANSEDLEVELSARELIEAIED